MMDNLTNTQILIIAVVGNLTMAILFRMAYLDNIIDNMKYHMLQYGSFVYLKTCTESQRELIYQQTPESYEEYMTMMADIDNNARKIVDKIQQNFKTNKRLIWEYFFYKLTYSDLYTEPSYLVKEFIPDKFPTEWEIKMWEKLNGFYNGVTAMQISRVKEMETIILQSMKREI